jgi:hypothetical protein
MRPFDSARRQKAQARASYFIRDFRPAQPSILSVVQHLDPLSIPVGYQSLALRDLDRHGNRPITATAVDLRRTDGKSRKLDGSINENVSNIDSLRWLGEPIEGLR